MCIVHLFTNNTNVTYTTIYTLAMLWQIDILTILKLIHISRCHSISNIAKANVNKLLMRMDKININWNFEMYLIYWSVLSVQENEMESTLKMWFNSFHRAKIIMIQLCLLYWILVWFSYLLHDRDSEIWNNHEYLSIHMQEKHSFSAVFTTLCYRL